MGVTLDYLVDRDRGRAVKNLGIVYVNIIGSGGCLVGLNFDTVTQCYSTGAVRGNSGIGGLVGSTSTGIL